MNTTKYPVFSLSSLLTGFGISAGMMILSLNAESAGEELCGAGHGRVARALFTTEIINREPVNRVLILENDQSQLYFFSDLRQFQGETVIHRWEFEGQTVMKKSFDVKGPRWRVYSSHDLETDRLGKWTAVITDKNNCPIKAVVFEYTPKDEGLGSAILKVE